jgi:hypothetical protein
MIVLLFFVEGINEKKDEQPTDIILFSGRFRIFIDSRRFNKTISMDQKRILELTKQRIAENKIPRELYKHTSISNNLYKTLINAELWFASPTSFNDPFDCQINDQTNWTDENIRDFIIRTAWETGQQIDSEKIVRKNREMPGGFNSFFSEQLKKTLSEIGVTCFLQRPDNLLLWAHYSASHTGVCLKFDITEDLDLFGLTFRVEYSDEYPSFDYLTERDTLVKKAMLSKSRHWEYEAEVRTMQKKYGLFPFKKECLKEIIFGCKADPSEIKTIREIVQNTGYPNLILRQAKLRRNEYNIDIVDI